MKRREFILSLFLALSGFKANAGSLDLDQLQELRGDAGYDVESLERAASSYYLNILNKGKQLGGGVGRKITNRQIQSAMDSIATPLWAASTRKLEWNIVLTDSPQVNACTPGGGLIIIYFGLLAQCKKEEELASAIAHEIGHIQHKHAIRRMMTQVVQKEMGIDPNSPEQLNKMSMESLMENAVKIIHRSFKRVNEYQADAFIIHAFLKAGYSPAKASLLFHRLNEIFPKANPNYCIFDTHPLNAQRIQRLEALAATYGNKGRSENSEAFNQLKRLIG